MSKGGLPYPCNFHTEDDGLFHSFYAGCVQCLQYEIYKLEKELQNTKEADG